MTETPRAHRVYTLLSDGKVVTRKHSTAEVIEARARQWRREPLAVFQIIKSPSLPDIRWVRIGGGWYTVNEGLARILRARDGVAA